MRQWMNGRQARQRICLVEPDVDLDDYYAASGNYQKLVSSPPSK